MRPFGGGTLPDDLFEDVAHAHAGLAARGDGFRAVEADDLFDLLLGPVDVGARQIDLVQNREDLEPLVEREVHVRERLRLDPLGRIDHQNGALRRRPSCARPRS